MDMQLYALLKGLLEDFEVVSGYKLLEVAKLPDVIEDDVIYIINPDKEGDN